MRMRTAAQAVSADAMREARSGDGLILLDVANDAYHCIYAPAAQTGAAVERLSPEGCVSGDALPECAVDATTPRARRWQERSVGDTPQTLSVGFIARALVSLMIATIRFHRADFAGLIASAEQLHVAPVAGDEEASLLVARFERCAAWFPFRMQCLFRTYVLLHLLSAAGHRVQWVFGASLFPFRAHCWLAQDGQLLNESAEHLLGYEVLLTVPVASA
jgi:hypothetical protein